MLIIRNKKVLGCFMRKADMYDHWNWGWRYISKVAFTPSAS
jgi:hypothetical protein